MYNPQPSPNIHKLISKVNVQSSAQHQRTQTKFQNKFQIPGPHPSYEHNFQNICPISSPTHTHNINSKIKLNPPRSPRMHKTNHKSNLQSSGQSQHTQNEFRHKCQLPSPYLSYNNNFQNEIKSFLELAKLCLVVTDEKG